MPAPHVVILGAAEPFSGAEPSALVTPSGDRRTLDWIIEAFDAVLEDPELHFVGGYRLKNVVDAYPDIHFSRNVDWEQTGTVASLFSAPLPTDAPVYVCYADTIFEASVITALQDGDPIRIAVDGTWRDRYRARDWDSLKRAEKVAIDDGRLADAGQSLTVEAADAEFTGLVRLSPEAVKRAQSLWDAQTIDVTADLPTLLCALQATNLTISVVDIEGDWAELETAQDLSRFVLDTKANALRRLQSMVERSVILDQHTFTVADWEANSKRVCRAIADQFDGAPVIVRSSARAEDGWEESQAGAFESVLDVPSRDETVLREAIEQAIASYPDNRLDNQVLIQPMIDDVSQSGVVMTRALDTGSPYYVINYDATTTNTESVTSGTGDHLQTAVVCRDVVELDGTLTVAGDLAHPQWPADISMEALLGAIRELETVLAHDSLDVEFVVDSADTVYVLQTRPITLDPSTRSVNDETAIDGVNRARKAFADAQTPPPQLLGDRAIYGVMPDWNPAEIIGRQPRQLAASLYRYLVMDDVWARQRAEYGYRDVRPAPLMQSFAGQPYVDVRADFNSWIPASVPDALAERLIAYYLDRLEANPELHDKVEFEIALTCLTFDYDDRIEPLLDAGFSREELEPLHEGLREITHEAMGRVEEDLATIDTLEARFDALEAADLPPLETAHLLLEDCRRLGTLPFAHLARTAFVATELLRSLERVGVLSAEEVAAFQASLTTVARRFERDGQRVAMGDLDRKTFVERYGHLRPGTYEITSSRYDADFDRYLAPMITDPDESEAGMVDGGQIAASAEDGNNAVERPSPHDVWDAATRDEIADNLERIGLDPDVDRFVTFLVDAIEGREYAKFVFSRNLSAALEQIADFGAQHDLDRDDCSHVPIETYFECLHDQPAADLERWLADRVQDGRQRYAMATAVELPPLLMRDTDFVVFERPDREATFVTDKVITADLVELEGDADIHPDLDGTVVLIPQADPGYDWLFGHDIAGLITQYGGTNSHMTVRAAEFGLPAAIGVGEAVYESLCGADVVELNCAAMDVTPL